MGEPGLGAGEPGLGAGEPGLGAGEPGLGGGEPGLWGVQGVSSQPASQKKLGVADTLISVARPIRIKVSGPNLNVMNFLYNLCNCKKTYELDDLYFQGTQEGRIECTTTVNIHAWVEKITPIN
jgi:hypothetical protein